jgi:hypothetical protein
MEAVTAAGLGKARIQLLSEDVRASVARRLAFGDPGWQATQRPVTPA